MTHQKQVTHHESSVAHTAPHPEDIHHIYWLETIPINYETARNRCDVPELNILLTLLKLWSLGLVVSGREAMFVGFVAPKKKKKW